MSVFPKTFADTLIGDREFLRLRGTLDPVQLARARRIAWLMLATALMSIADLMCTLTYMRISGMLEANPLARFMITIGDAQQLIHFKLGMIALCWGSLYLGRRHPRAELSAWICTAIMLLLTLHWINYNASVSLFTNDMAVLALSNGEFEPAWVKIDP